MIRKIKSTATHIGIGVGAVYAFFLIPQIEGLFKIEFIVLLRQSLAVVFAACLLINPRSLVESGESFAPKLISVLRVLFNSDKNMKDENNN